MKKLIVVRHGEYDLDHLNDCGRAQINALAEKLKPFINGASILMLTSTADSARESAEILGAILDISFEEHGILNTALKESLEELLILVRSRKDEAEVLVMVTHHEYAKNFPAYFAREELRCELLSQSIRKGQAWILDCQQKTLTKTD